jgi:hypothetical protein
MSGAHGARRTLRALVALSMSIAGATLAQAPRPASNVPDVLTRQSGLRVAPMPRAAQTYATNCQGCLGDLGSSAKEIPTLAGRF